MYLSEHTPLFSAGQLVSVDAIGLVHTWAACVRQTWRILEIHGRAVTLEAVGGSWRRVRRQAFLMSDMLAKAKGV